MAHLPRLKIFEDKTQTTINQSSNNGQIKLCSNSNTIHALCVQIVFLYLLHFYTPWWNKHYIMLSIASMSALKITKHCFKWHAKGKFFSDSVSCYQPATLHSSLEGVKIENKLTGAGINAKNCKNTSSVTTKNFKIGQRGNPELWPILSFFTYFMVGWVGVPT